MRTLVLIGAFVTTFIIGTQVSCSDAGSCRSLLAIFAHMDDEIIIAPLLVHYAKQGVRVQLAVVIDGAKGGGPALNIPPGEQSVAVRKKEVSAACRS